MVWSDSNIWRQTCEQNLDRSRGSNVSISRLGLHYKALTRGRTDHFSNFLADRKITQLLLFIYSVRFGCDFLQHLTSVETVLALALVSCCDSECLRILEHVLYG